MRFNFGHYLASESVATATANNPVNTRINSASRTWIDTNGNYFPDCNLTNPAANGECGALTAPIGIPNVVTHWDPAVVNGWGVRPSANEVLVGLQQLLKNRLMLDLQWTRHSFGNLCYRSFARAQALQHCSPGRISQGIEGSLFVSNHLR